MSFLSIFKWDFWSIQLSSGNFLCAKSWVYLCCIVLLTLMFWIAVVVTAVNSKGTNHCTMSSLHLEVCVMILMDWLYSFLDLFHVFVAMFWSRYRKGRQATLDFILNSYLISKRIWVLWRVAQQLVCGMNNYVLINNKL